MKTPFFYLSIMLTVIGLSSLEGCTKAQNPPSNKTIEYDTTAKAVDAETNTHAADFTLNDINSAPVHLSDFTGKVRIVDFWATWCPPCVQEIPHFNDLYTQYKDSGLVVIGISVDQGGWEAVKKFLEKTPIYYPVLQEDVGYEYRPESFAASEKLAAKLTAKGTAFLEYLWGRLPLDKQAGLLTMTTEEVAVILNGFVLGENMYNGDRFAGVDLGVEPKRLEGFNPEGEKLRHFNRFLLEAVFKDYMKPKVSDIYQSYLPPDQRGGIPYTFVLDREGFIKERFVGFRPKEVFEEAILKLL